MGTLTFQKKYLLNNEVTVKKEGFYLKNRRFYRHRTYILIWYEKFKFLKIWPLRIYILGHLKITEF